MVVSVFKLKILIKKKFLSSSDAKNDSNSWRMDFQPFSFLIDGGKQSELFFGWNSIIELVNDLLFLISNRFIE